MVKSDRKEKRKVITGNYSAAWGARCARVDVISAYPITPQTTVVEKLSEFVDGGKMDNTKFIKVESEHSVMASQVGASIAGARCFTATSGQGLLYMAEMVHWAAGARLPIVTTIASRGIAPPWNIWADFSDLISVRDSGWMISFASTHQEILDSVIMAYRISENKEVLLPHFVGYGGFVLSHTSKPVVIPAQAKVDGFLPPKPENGWPHIFMDPDRPMMHGNLILPPSFYAEFRMKIHDAQMRAKEFIKETAREFKKQFGRDYGNGLVYKYRCDDADVCLLNTGGLAKQCEVAVDELRDEGYRVGSVALRYFRPFPVEDVVQLASEVPVIGVCDRDMAYGSPTGGAVSSEVKAALFDSQTETKTRVMSIIAGLGGRDVTVEQQKDMFMKLVELKEKGTMPSDLIHGTYWSGLITGE
ncbi:MAG: pyruvate ferredoxin oxidoreductase [Promethearchaeota archaeon]